MSLIISQIAKAVFGETVGKTIDGLSENARCWLGIVAWIVFVVILFWFPSESSYNPFYANQTKNIMTKDEGWEFAKVVFPAIWGFFGVKKCYYNDEFPLFWTGIFALLVLSALGYALKTSGWF